MKLLLLSNSTNAGDEYLSFAQPYFQKFLLGKKLNALFIPYAGVSINWDEYFELVHTKLRSIGINLTSIHKANNEIEALENTALIIVGGGNTFSLLKTLQEKKLLQVIRNKVHAGVPYIGWSAGSNLSCPTIRTTNDMPIVEPENFNALNLIPFQINPHYNDTLDVNHAGETREMRINEFLIANPQTFVAGLREGTAFEVNDNKIALLGDKSCRIFKHGQDAIELNTNNDFSFLMQ